MYKILKIVHNKKSYNNIDEVFEAWHRGDLVRTVDDTTNWASRAIQGKQRDLDDRAGPRQVMFDGARHRVDMKEDWVSWMDWTFYFSFERDMGLHLWDMSVEIRFNSFLSGTDECIATLAEKGSYTSYLLRRLWHSIPVRIHINQQQSG